MTLREVFIRYYERRIREGGPGTADYEAEEFAKELREAGWIAVPHDISNRAIDLALASTSTWKNINGSALTVNREKMRLRWRSALIYYKNLEDGVISACGEQT